MATLGNQPVDAVNSTLRPLHKGRQYGIYPTRDGRVEASNQPEAPGFFSESNALNSSKRIRPRFSRSSLK